MVKRVHRSIGLCLSVFLLTSFWAAPTRAGELAGVSMSDRTQVGDQSLVLNGMGLRKKAIFKVYVAGLYLKARQQDTTQILSADSHRKLEMEFLRSVGKESLVGAWNDCLAASSGAGSSSLQRDFTKLNGWMEDVKTKDRMAFTYEPEKGLAVTVKGKKVGEIEGKPFADTLFGCWIGDSPPSADFKAGLLGR